MIPRFFIDSIGASGLSLLLIFSTFVASAQYTGGSGHGSIIIGASAQSLGENIYSGGENDGSNSISVAAVSLGESIYTGGENDGANVITVTLVSLGESIYIGGENDGNSVQHSNAVSLGESIYTGGENDGNSSLVANSISLGESIYAGGENDGSNSIVTSAVSLGESIYSGGMNDGSDFATANTISLGESIFQGGENDGSIVATANGVSLAESIYSGGDGMGFTFAFKNNTPLPIQLILFDAVWKNNDAVIQWKTAAEKNMNGYVLERSFDNQLYDSIYYTEANNQLNINQYSFEDIHVSEKYKNQQVFYYRLKQMELDGNVEYSVIATLNTLGNNGLQMSVYPNPVSEELHLNFNHILNEPLEILIYSNSGALIKKIVGQQQNSIKISELAAGNYKLQVLQNTQLIYTQQLTVVK